jgi:succinate dehydrogenase / fumarate reductase, cytochrome b subunit
MATSLTKENYLLHKLHSLTGIVPVGFYMVQHLTLNSFAIAGPARFDGVLHFFESLPKHVLLLTEALLIWLPLLFHAVYGLFITSRAEQNYIGTRYGWSQNRMYTFQRISGIFIFLFLIYHIATTTVAARIVGIEVIQYASWQAKLTENFYLILVLYLVGVLASSYHLAYGIWNFCIRWGITISERAQLRVQRFALAFFVGVTLLGWMALGGFLMHSPTTPVIVEGETGLAHAHPISAHRR